MDEGRKKLELRVQLGLLVLRVRQGDQVRTEGVRGKKRERSRKMRMYFEDRAH